MRRTKFAFGVDASNLIMCKRAGIRRDAIAENKLSRLAERRKLTISTHTAIFNGLNDLPVGRNDHTSCSNW